MAVTLHAGPPLDSLIEDSQEPTEPSRRSERLCIVGEGLSRRNLEEKLTREGTQLGEAASLTTIDEIAGRLIEADTGVEPNDLSDELVTRLIEEVFDRAVEGEYSEELREFAETVPYTNDETLETLYNELNDYYRCTDGGRDHDDLQSIAVDLSNVYAQQTGQRRLNQFRELTVVLEDLVSDLGEQIYVSRSHLVRAARNRVEDYWDEVFGETTWLGVATISTFDNPTLRLLLEIEEYVEGTDLNFYLGKGSYGRQKDRLSTILDQSFDDDDPEWDIPGDAGQSLFDAAIGEEVAIPPSVEFIEAPERRREVEYVVKDVREKLGDSADPQDILVLTRNLERYQAAIEDIFETNQIPYHIETKEPLAHAAGYRFIDATFQLVEAASEDREISYDAVTAPLRLGFCHPEANSSIWPLPQRIFLYLEQRLHKWEENDGWRSFSEWRAEVESATGWDLAWELMEDYMDWIASHRGGVPETGPQLRGLLRTLLGSHIYLTVTRERNRPDGPGVDLKRTRITEVHSTSHASEVYQLAAAAGQYYEYIQDIFDVDPGWEEVNRAIREVIGSQTIGTTHTDSNAIQVMEAGDADFVDADYVYLLGVSTGEFPVENEPSSFLHDELRDEVAERSETGDYPFLRLQSSRTQYNIDLDYYEKVIRASDAQVTLIHHYKDSEGNTVEWSPFVDLLPTGDLAHRVRVDEWLPHPNEPTAEEPAGTTWADTAVGVSEKDRLRLLYHHTERLWPMRRPTITVQDVREIAARTERNAVEQETMPRYDRYVRPPMEVSVSADEPAFENDLDLVDVVGEPVRTHELDLFSQCQLKFYFYQLLFNYEGDSVQRDEIPYYSSSHPHHRVGRLPQVIRHQYTSPYLDEAWESIINEKIRDRYQLAHRFNDLDELEEWFDNQDDLQSKRYQLLPALKNEWELVQHELASGSEIDRQWTWQEAQTINIGGTDVRIGNYRRDILNNDNGYALPVLNVRHPSYAEKAIKACWHSYDRNFRDESCGSLCQSCRHVDDCSRKTKFTLDHRLHTLTNLESSLAGVIYQDHYNRGPDSRYGMIKQGHINAFRGGVANDPERHLEDHPNPLSRPAWYSRQSDRDSDLSDHLDELTDDELTFEVDPGFVRLDGCDSCVYKDMCLVPERADI